MNCKANESPTITPTLSSEPLTIRRSSSVGRSTARAWYSLFRANETIQTGNVTNASMRWMRWLPSSASLRTIACQAKARAMPRATVTVSATISR